MLHTSHESTRQSELNRTIAFAWTHSLGALPLDASSSRGDRAAALLHDEKFGEARG
jgi:hypothetical protein